jgi:hypothetical protein
MSTWNSTASPAPRMRPVRHQDWLPGPGMLVLVMLWLALTALPLMWLGFADAGSAVDAEPPAPHPWVPIYPPIV